MTMLPIWAPYRKLEYVTEQENGELAPVLGERRRGGGVEILVRWCDGVRQWLRRKDIGEPAPHVRAHWLLVPRARQQKSAEDVLDDALEMCPDLPSDWRAGNDDAFEAFTEAFLAWRRQHDLDCALAPDTDYRCKACGREEIDCSLNPCEAVKRDRES